MRGLILLMHLFDTAFGQLEYERARGGDGDSHVLYKEPFVYKYLKKEGIERWMMQNIDPSDEFLVQRMTDLQEFFKLAKEKFGDTFLLPTVTIDSNPFRNNERTICLVEPIIHGRTLESVVKVLGYKDPGFGTYVDYLEAIDYDVETIDWVRNALNKYSEFEMAFLTSENI